MERCSVIHQITLSHLLSQILPVISSAWSCDDVCCSSGYSSCWKVFFSTLVSPEIQITITIQDKALVQEGHTAVTETYNSTSSPMDSMSHLQCFGLNTHTRAPLPPRIWGFKLSFKNFWFVTLFQ